MIQATGARHHPPSVSTFRPGSQHPAKAQKQLSQIDEFDLASPLTPKSSLKNKSKKHLDSL